SSLIIFFFITGGTLIYIALTYFLATIYFNLLLFIIIIIIVIITDSVLIITYIKSNVYIKPLECWFEVYRRRIESDFEFLGIVYYPIFSGKCHPNAAKNVIYKLYQDQMLKSKIDVTQIEVYLKLDLKSNEIIEKIGYFFQYGEGNLFKEENIDRDSWKFFQFEDSQKDNFFATANWDHQYEWRDDLEFDFDKLHEYAPWVIQRWNSSNIKPLTDDFKTKINWPIRHIKSKPKLKPWLGELLHQTYKNPKAYEDLRLIDNAIENVDGIEEDVSKVRKIKDKLPSIKSYFRDLKS
ncbi:MAG: hypothetical protein ACW99L_17535, partial [Promethearchaeota archaeon]